jgi:DNA polymerase I-like protein with 3'-5' exonuclease and polymerase domains
VVSILHIRLEQIKKSGHQKIGNHNYKPFFVQHMLHQMSDTAHQLSHLREDGSLVDPKYLKFLTTVESPLRTEMKRLAEIFRIFPSAVDANDKILANSGLKTKGLSFGGLKRKAASWVLSLTKPAHLRVLFFDVMGFEPVSKTKEGTPSVDKAFVSQYKDKNPIVEGYGDYTKLAKLMGTYAKGWYKKLIANSDSATDNCLRPDYSTFDVTTGRLASKNPSLHTIPSRGKLVKIIKRMFVAPPGKLLIRYDYSAHEVRVWSYVGLDKVLAAVFRVGQKLRQAYIQNPTEEAKKDIKAKGDIHILNVKRLLGKDVDKDHPLRDAIKQVIFGLLYGKSAETLGEDTKLGDKTELKETIGKLSKDPTKAKELRIAEKKLRDLMAEDRTGYAQGLIEKIFKEFSKGGAWTNRMKKMAEEEYYVYSPIGRKRNLFAAMIGDRKIVGQQARRGSNAPIQGMASEIGVKAGRLVMEAYYKELPTFCKMLGIEYDPWELRIPYNRMVHDASYYSVEYAMVIPFIHILQYVATYGVTKAYKDEFNFEFTIEPEIELEVGVRDDSTNKWDWSLPNIVECVNKSVDNAVEFGMLDAARKQSVMEEIFRPWAKKEMRAYLQSKFPLLNVPDLDKQIVAAIKPIYRKKDESVKVLDTVA